jgi:hypothetical protein
MGMFINAQEDIIAREATRQILALNPAIAAKLQPKEVIAYTLNRVPPRYATTQQGMLRQRQSAIAELATTRNTISRALQSVLNSDPDTFTLNFPVRLRGVATHYCSRKQRLHPAHHWTRRRYPAKL